MSIEKQIHGWFLVFCALCMLGFSCWLAVVRGIWGAWFLAACNLTVAVIVTRTILSERKAQS